MPLCARCTGIYTGLFLTVLFLLVFGRLQRRRLPPVPAIVLGLGFFAAMAADVFTVLLGWRETNNAFRLVTGTLTGMAIPALGLPLANSIVREGREKESGIMNAGEFALVSAVVIVLTLLAMIRSPLLFQAFSLISVAGLWLFMLNMNALPLSSFLGERWKSWVVPGSLVATVGELMILAGLHRWLLRLQGPA